MAGDKTGQVPRAGVPLRKHWLGGCTIDRAESIASGKGISFRRAIACYKTSSILGRSCAAVVSLVWACAPFSD